MAGTEAVRPKSILRALDAVRIRQRVAACCRALPVIIRGGVAIGEGCLVKGSSGKRGDIHSIADTRCVCDTAAMQGELFSKMGDVNAEHLATVRVLRGPDLCCDGILGYQSTFMNTEFCEDRKLGWRECKRRSVERGFSMDQIHRQAPDG